MGWLGLLCNYYDTDTSTAWDWRYFTSDLRETKPLSRIFVWPFQSESKMNRHLVAVSYLDELSGHCE